MTRRPSPETLAAARQQQFLEVVDRDTAESRFHEHLDLAPLEAEEVPLGSSLGRILSHDVLADVDVPAFDRSNVDGFAVQAADTAGAMEEEPRQLTINDEVLAPGVQASIDIAAGTATTIATGAVVPRGADAVVMVEHTRVDDQGRLLVEHAVAPERGSLFPAPISPEARRYCVAGNCSRREKSASWRPSDTAASRSCDVPAWPSSRPATRLSHRESQ